jgi:hypothetical protein
MKNKMSALEKLNCAKMNLENLAETMPILKKNIIYKSIKEQIKNCIQLVKEES